MQVRTRTLPLPTLLLALCTGLPTLPAGEFASSWHNAPDRIWVGEEFWANPMEDWRVRDGRLECIRPGGNRNVHSLTAQLGKKDGHFELRARLGLDDPGKGGGTAGFRIGIQTEFDDYLHRVFKGSGLNAGVTTAGDLFIGNPIPKPTGRGLDRKQLAAGENVLAGCD